LEKKVSAPAAFGEFAKIDSANLSVEEFNKAVTFHAPNTRKTLWRKEMSNLVTYLT